MQYTVHIRRSAGRSTNNLEPSPASRNDDLPMIQDLIIGTGFGLIVYILDWNLLLNNLNQQVPKTLYIIVKASKPCKQAQGKNENPVF